MSFPQTIMGKYGWEKVTSTSQKQKAEEVAEEYRCDEQDCNFFAVSESHSGKLSSLRMHKRSAHK